MKKRLTALLLAMSMLMTLLAGCKPNTSKETNTPEASPESSQPEQTEQPAATDYDNPELVRAVEYGFVSSELRSKDVGETITYREYCAMIIELVRAVDSGLVDEWNEIAALGLQSDEEMLRDQGCVVLYRAMELLAMDHIPYDYISVTPHSFEVFFDFQPEPSYDYRAFAGDEPWVFEDIRSDFDTESHPYYQIAIMMCYEVLSLCSFELLYNPDIPISEQLTIEDAVCSVVRLYESRVDVAAKYWKPRQESLRQAIAKQEEPEEITQRRDAILNSETAIVKGDTYISGETYSGTAYYISNNGNDNNDGRSPETAWATLDRFAKQPYSSGDALFLERGGTYRGHLELYAPGLTVSAYGEGPKPVVTSGEDGTGEEKWELYFEGSNGEKIWKFYKDVTDAGTVVFDDSAATRKITAVWSGTEWVNEDGSAFDIVAGLTEDLEFFSDDGGKFGGATDVWGINDAGTPADVQYGPLYLRCDRGNPGSLYSRIELCTIPVSQDRGYRGAVLSTGESVTLDNLSLKYYSFSAVEYGQNDCVIQNCEFAWGGGCVQIMQNGVVIGGRAGDALCGGQASNMTIRNNYFHDLYSQALIFEIDSGETKDILFSGNLVERTSGINISYWSGEIEGLVIDGNIFTQSGLSWGDLQDLCTVEEWAGGAWMKYICIRLYNQTHIDCQITNNSFYDFLQTCFYFGTDVPGEMPVMSGNRYYISEYSDIFAWWTTSDIPQLYHTIGVAEAEDFLRDYLHDTTSFMIRGTRS